MHPLALCRKRFDRLLSHGWWKIILKILGCPTQCLNPGFEPRIFSAAGQNLTTRPLRCHTCCLIMILYSNERSFRVGWKSGSTIQGPMQLVKLTIICSTHKATDGNKNLLYFILYLHICLTTRLLLVSCLFKDLILLKYCLKVHYTNNETVEQNLMYGVHICL